MGSTTRRMQIVNTEDASHRDLSSGLQYVYIIQDFLKVHLENLLAVCGLRASADVGALKLQSFCVVGLFCALFLNTKLLVLQGP